MNRKKTTLGLLLTLVGIMNSPVKAQSLTDYVNPLLGTATLWSPEDLGYTHTEEKRAWGAEVFPGSSLPNAMVQLTPVTKYHSGSGYQYEDREIYGFAHTCKGHWNLLHVPVMPVTGFFYPRNYASHFSHERESARPGYYSVWLERYGIQAELTSTLRCAFHRYTFRPEDEKHLLVDISRSNGRPRPSRVSRTAKDASISMPLPTTASAASTPFRTRSTRLPWWILRTARVRSPWRCGSASRSSA